MGLLRNIISSAAAVYHRFSLRAAVAYHPSMNALSWKSVSLIGAEETGTDRGDDSAAQINFPLFSPIFHASDVSRRSNVKVRQLGDTEALRHLLRPEQRRTLQSGFFTHASAGRSETRG